MGWLWLVGSIKWWVSFAKEPYKRDDILQERRIILSNLLTVATSYRLSKEPYIGFYYMWSATPQICTCVYTKNILTHTHMCICMYKYVYIHYNVYIYTHIHICMYIYIYICIHTYMLSIYICIHVYICTHTCIYVCKYVCVHT